MKKFFEYVTVILSSGTHEFQYNAFVPCLSEDGLSQEEIEDFLLDHHDRTETPYSDGLSDGMYWTNNDTSCGVFSQTRQSKFGTRGVFEADSEEIKTLKTLAPELFKS